MAHNNPDTGGGERINIFKDGVLVGHSYGLNFETGSNVTLTGVDQTGTLHYVTMTVASSGGGGGSLTVQEADVTVDAAATTLDFQGGFDITSSPAGEANVALDLSEVANSGELTFTGNTPVVNASHSGSAHHAQSHDHSAAGDGTTLTPAVLNIPATVTPAQTADGQAVWDSDDNLLTVGDGTARRTFLPVIDATSDPTNVSATASADGTEASSARKDHRHVHASIASGDLHTEYIPEAIVDAKGDIIAATAADTPARLGVGADDTILMADAAAATGLKWVASATPVAVTPDAAAAAGTSDDFSRASHQHGIVTASATPAAVSTAGAAGTSGNAPSRSDHVHAHETAHVAHDTIWDAANDYVRGSGADTAVRQAASAATPAAVSTAGSAGTAANPPSADDHVHAHEAAHINHDTTWAAKGDLIAGTANDTAAVLTVGSNGQVPVADSAQSTGLQYRTMFTYTTFSKTGTLATGTGATRWYNDTGRTLTFDSTRASVGTAPTGASILIDVNKDGTTIFTTQASRPTIAVSTNTDQGSAPDVTTIANGSYLTVDIDQVGSTVAGADLTVQIWMTG